MGGLERSPQWRGTKAIVLGRLVRTADDVEEPTKLFQDDTIPSSAGKPRPSNSQNLTLHVRWDLL